MIFFKKRFQRPLRIFIWIGMIVSAICRNEVFYKKIDLEEMIRASSHILLGRISKPSYSDRNIKINTKLLKKLGINTKLKNDVPDFRVKIQHFKVAEVYKGNLEENEIKVFPANFESDLYIHILYYGIGYSESPIYHVYESSQIREADLENQYFILFLSNANYFHEFRWSFLGAMESLNYKEEILNVIQKSIQ
ncbi:hypothetical protein [Leptospira interrogans]|uniref:hypothetical protein n=1 Tax=Leptospira interrogans TaxID=173 RepID=UPI000774AFB4|nr:hypothetical protein [Leptospira interrogans]